MFKDKEQNNNQIWRKNYRKRIKKMLLDFYLTYLKIYTDRIPFFRLMAQYTWKRMVIGKLKIRGLLTGVNLEKTHWINPDLIQYRIVEKYRDNYEDMIIPFEETECFQGFYQHFIEGKEWIDTSYYQSAVWQINHHKYKWGCTSEKELMVRCQQMDALYREIRDKGYKQQHEINNDIAERKRGIREFSDEIVLAVGLGGELILCEGQHRLTIAKLLKLNLIPCKIH